MTSKQGRGEGQNCNSFTQIAEKLGAVNNQYINYGSV